MHIPIPRRTRRALTATAAAAAVILVPACDLASAGAPRGNAVPVPSTDSGYSGQAEQPGHTDHYGHGSGGASIAPVANTSTPSDTAEPADGITEEPIDGPTEQPTEEPGDKPTEEPTEEPAEEPADGSTDEPADPPPPPPTNGLDPLGQDCTGSTLEPHDGFQVAPRCVGTAFGEVAGAAQSPSLLITSAPDDVAAATPFTLAVSTRNLVRDRFLGAAAGGYYLESSFLNGEGIQRGHFHTACRMLETTEVAPDAAPAPAFFLATQDGGGGTEPDTVEVAVPGLPAGTAQCAVWAGDGSHRVPMMQRANQVPAFDIVRITVG